MRGVKDVLKNEHKDERQTETEKGEGRDDNRKKVVFNLQQVT